MSDEEASTAQGGISGKGQAKRGITYSFLDGAKLLKLLAQSALLGVPCQATGLG